MGPMISYVDYRVPAQRIGWEDYSLKSYNNSQIFKTLFGGSPSEWGSRAKAQHSGANGPRISAIAKNFGLSEDYVRGINLADECINYQSGAHLRGHLLPGNFGCTSVGINGVIGQTLDLFTVELCIVREEDSLYVTMPPYLCLFGMNQHIAMCTNHLFDSVSFDGTPISCIRRSILDCQALDEVITFLAHLRPTTSVNLLVSDGKSTLDIELSRTDMRIIPTQWVAGQQVVAHTNHRVAPDFLSEVEGGCQRLKTALSNLQGTPTVEEVLQHPAIVQPIADGFGTIVTAWMDPLQKIFAYRSPEAASFTRMAL